MRFALHLGVASALCITLAGCGTDRAAVPKTDLQIVPQVVKVPVATSCVPATLGPKPTYVDTKEALRNAPDAAARYQLVTAGREQRDARLGEVEPVIANCRTPGQTPAPANPK